VQVLKIFSVNKLQYMNTTNTPEAHMKNQATHRWQQIKEVWALGKRVEEDVSTDMHMMHQYYGVNDAVENLSPSSLASFIKFRYDFLQEEVNEGKAAITERNSEEIVDSLIDIIVVAVGTLDLLQVDFQKAWFEVLKANMAKHVGVKESRPNPLSLPDLIKPEDWTAPDHTGNHGLIEKAFSDHA
jgi:predicted HAD superfamily Cof-like phosphohydrolase